MWKNKTEIKQILKPVLNKFFETHDYKYVSKIRGGGGNVGFKSKSLNPIYYLSYFVYESGKITFTPIAAHFDEVEEIMFDIRLPNKSAKHFYDKPFEKLNEDTIMESISQTNGQEFTSQTLYETQDVIDVAHTIVKYMQSYGFRFQATFKSIKDVSNHLEKLIINDEPLQQIIPSQPNIYFKALIILKLGGSNIYNKTKENFRNKINSEYNKKEIYLKAFDNLVNKLKLM